MASLKSRLAAAGVGPGAARSPAGSLPATDHVFAEYGATPHGGRTAESAGEQKVPQPSEVKEQSYIPLSVAQDTIKRMTGDMEAMRARHADLLRKVQQYYSDREATARQHYVSYIEDMRSRANTRIQYYRSAATELKQELTSAEAQRQEERRRAAAAAAEAEKRVAHLEAQVDASGGDSDRLRQVIEEQHAQALAELREELAQSQAATKTAEAKADAAEAAAAAAATLPTSAGGGDGPAAGPALAALHAAHAAFPALKRQLQQRADAKLDAREATIAALQQQVAALQAALAKAGQGATVLAATAEKAGGAAADPQAAVRLAALEEDRERLAAEVQRLQTSPRGEWAAAPSAAVQPAQSDEQFLTTLREWQADPPRAQQLRDLGLLNAPPVDPAAREAALAPFREEAREGQPADKEAKKAIKEQYHAYDALSAQHKEQVAAADAASASNAEAQRRLQEAEAALARAEEDFAAGRLSGPPPAAASGAELRRAKEEVARLQARLQAADSERDDLQARLDARADAGGDSVPAAELAVVEASLAQQREAAAQAQQDLAAAQGTVAALKAELAAGGSSSASPEGDAAEVADLQTRQEELEGEVAALQDALESAKAQAAEDAIAHRIALAQAATSAAQAGAGGGSGGPSLREDLEALIEAVGAAIAHAKTLWKEKKKSEVCSVLQDTISDVLGRLGKHDYEPLQPLLQALQSTREEAASLKVSKAALALRTALDAFVKDAAALLEGDLPEPAQSGGAGDDGASAAALAALQAELQAAQAATKAAQAAAASRPAHAAPAQRSAHGGAPSADAREASRRADRAEKKVAVLQDKVAELKAQVEAAQADAGRGGGRGGAAASGGSSAAEGRLKEALEKEKGKVKDKEKELRSVKAELKKASVEIARLEKGTGAAASEADKEVRRMQKQMDSELKKAAKAQDEAVAKVTKDLTRKTKEADALAARGEELEGRLAEVTAERDGLKAQVGGMGDLQAELEGLRAQSAALVEAQASIKELEKQGAELAKLYREEQVKRKRLHNALEDMKGKIRVYARCRPPNKRERDLKSPSVVSMPDDMTITLGTDKGDRNFVYDHVFGPTSTQPEVYEEVDNLIQSAFDGYNVCIFAYGQTGSGKTFTMLGATAGGGELLGVTPRAIARLFSIMEENADSTEVSITTTMVELYNDNLHDLYFMVDHAKAGGSLKPPRLEVKMDRKKRVFIQGAAVREAHSPAEVLAHFDEGNAARKTGSTKMNAESSRSHLVFTIMIQVRNTATGKTSFGKLTLVDLAGSERVSKTGADAERLREAQSINRSLAALGNVINKLSSTEGTDEGPGHVPYRDNLLTRVLQDGLGGSAKTLMFVNISPAEDNTDETLSSLQYAERVKKITNTAAKSEESKLVRHLKATIRRLRAGEAVHEDDEAVDGEGEEEGGPVGTAAG
ncbi:KIN14I [Symbiodinium sp. KB8]|nr:KIN14I [Symbiodinium sp. KB8]